MNQNNQPIILTEKVIIQSGTPGQPAFTPFIRIDSGMGPNDQLNIHGISCHIRSGGQALNDDDLQGVTFSDILDIHWPTRDQEYLTLPLCCDPRPGMGEALYLELWRDTTKQILRKNAIPLALFNNADHIDPEMEGDPTFEENFRERHTGKMLIFTEPVAYYPSEGFNIRVRNDNIQFTARDPAYSIVDISFICEIVDKRATMELLAGEINGLEDMQ